MTLYERLMEVRDEEYRAFQMNLVPNVPPETIIGVRTPAMRAIAKELSKSPDRDAFLSTLPHPFRGDGIRRGGQDRRGHARALYRRRRKVSGEGERESHKVRAEPYPDRRSKHRCSMKSSH